MKENSRLSKLIGTKSFYKMVLRVAVPIMIQNGITNFVSMLDNIMVGQIGTEQMSGVAIVNQLMQVFNVCIFGAISGAGIFGAQYFGKGNMEGVRDAFRFKVWISSLFTLIGILIFWCAGSDLITMYLHDGSDVGDVGRALYYGQQYLNVMMIGMIPFAISQMYASTLRECGETVVPMKAGIACCCRNTCGGIVQGYKNDFKNVIHDRANAVYGGNTYNSACFCGYVYNRIYDYNKGVLRNCEEGGVIYSRFR